MSPYPISRPASTGTRGSLGDPGQSRREEILWEIDERAWLSIEPNAARAGAGRITLEVAGLDALLERLARLRDEVHGLNTRLDQNEGLLRMSHQLSLLNESLQALAYAALGQQSPQVRRRRAGSEAALDAARRR